MKETPVNNPEHKIKGRRLLILFGLVVLLLFAISMISGVYLRGWVHSLGGSVVVDVRNDAAMKLRADIYAGAQYAPLELEPGEAGRLRFAPKEPVPLKIRLFHNNHMTRSKEFGEFQPATPAVVHVVLESQDEMSVKLVDPESIEALDED